MDYFDIFLIAVVLIAGITGYISGVIKRIGAVAALVLAIVACRLFGSDITAALVAPGSEHATLIKVLIYSALFLVVYFSVRLVARLLGKIASAMCLGFLDRLAGALYSILFWLIMVSLALNVWFAVVPADASRLCPKSKPWRTAVVDLAPTLAGYIVKK